MIKQGKNLPYRTKCGGGFPSIFSCILINLSLMIAVATKSSTTSTTSTARQETIIDLSYQFDQDIDSLLENFVKGTTTTTTIGSGDDVDLGTGINNEKKRLIQVDLSSTLLKDEGVSALANCCLLHCDHIHDSIGKNLTEEVTSGGVTSMSVLDLRMKMNQITHVGASDLFEKVLEINQLPTSTDESSADESSAVSPYFFDNDNKNETNETVSGEIDMNNSTNSTNINVTSFDSDITIESTNSTTANISSSITDLVNKNDEQEITQKTSQKREKRILIQSLDLSFNNLGIIWADKDDDATSTPRRRKSRAMYSKNKKRFMSSLQNLIQSSNISSVAKFSNKKNEDNEEIKDGNYSYPITSLTLEQCSLDPSVCRAIGKGIIQRFSSSSLQALSSSEEDFDLAINLHLAGNKNIGDAGTAAIAAALRRAASSVASSKTKGGTTAIKQTLIIDTLDLSSCDVSDIGIETLALAIEKYPGCIGTLILNHNRITNQGVSALARALCLWTSQLKTIGDTKTEVEAESSNTHHHVHLYLNNNKDISDQSASSLVIPIQKDILRTISLKSCSIHADGAKAFGSLLPSIFSSSKTSSTRLIHIDLSDNPLGVYKKKKQKKNKTTASASVVTKMIGNKASSFISKGIGGLVGSAIGSSSTVESDDDFEKENEQDFDDELNSIPKIPPTSDDPFDTTRFEATLASEKCGARFFADPIVNCAEPKEIDSLKHHRPTFITLGMRHCSLDRNAPNALAAAILCAQNRLGINLNVDTSLNEDIDNDVINELKQTTPNSAGSTLLKKMGETYLNGLEAIRKAKERAAEAALAREREENWSLDQDSNEYEGSEEEVFGGFEYGDEEGFYDYDDSYEGNGNTYFDNDVNYSYDEY